MTGADANRAFQAGRDCANRSAASSKKRCGGIAESLAQFLDMGFCRGHVPCAVEDVSHLRRLRVLYVAGPALPGWANFWRAYGARGDSALGVEAANVRGPGGEGVPGGCSADGKGQMVHQDEEDSAPERGGLDRASGEKVVGHEHQQQNVG